MAAALQVGMVCGVRRDQRVWEACSALVWIEMVYDDPSTVVPQFGLHSCGSEIPGRRAKRSWVRARMSLFEGVEKLWNSNGLLGSEQLRPTAP
mmetsp:Transcript_25219/g.61365  ORF Transcript_25219/g.61365 Transcript_25219/m.61365 type:complete len:93 (-) Transcript_25219:66-344(-)